jgi:hypothetical protein
LKGSSKGIDGIKFGSDLNTEMCGAVFRNSVYTTECDERGLCDGNFITINFKILATDEPVNGSNMSGANLPNPSWIGSVASANLFKAMTNSKPRWFDYFNLDHKLRYQHQFEDHFFITGSTLSSTALQVRKSTSASAAVTSLAIQPVAQALQRQVAGPDQNIGYYKIKNIQSK